MAAPAPPPGSDGGGGSTPGGSTSSNRPANLFSCVEDVLAAFTMEGDIAWQVPLPNGALCQPLVKPVAGFHGMVYVATSTRVFAINSSAATPPNPPDFQPPILDSTLGDTPSGAPRPSYVADILGLTFVPRSPPGIDHYDPQQRAAKGGVLYVNAGRKGLYALRGDGSPLWASSTTSGVAVAFRVRAEGRADVSCGSDSDPCQFRFAPAVDACSGVVYVTNADGYLYAVHGDMPSMIWRTRIPLPDRFASNPASAGPSMCSVVLDATAGADASSSNSGEDGSTGSGGGVSSSDGATRTGAQGTVYVSCGMVGQLAAFSAAKGELLWMMDTGAMDPRASTPAAGMLAGLPWTAVGSTDGRLYGTGPGPQGPWTRPVVPAPVTDDSFPEGYGAALGSVFSATFAQAPSLPGCTPLSSPLPSSLAPPPPPTPGGSVGGGDTSGTGYGPAVVFLWTSAVMPLPSATVVVSVFMLTSAPGGGTPTVPAGPVLVRQFQYSVGNGLGGARPTDFVAAGGILYLADAGVLVALPLNATDGVGTDCPTCTCSEGGVGGSTVVNPFSAGICVDGGDSGALDGINMEVTGPVRRSSPKVVLTYILAPVVGLLLLASAAYGLYTFMGLRRREARLQALFQQQEESRIAAQRAQKEALEAALAEIRQQKQELTDAFARRERDASDASPGPGTSLPDGPPPPDNKPLSATSTMTPPRDLTDFNARIAELDGREAGIMEQLSQLARVMATGIIGSGNTSPGVARGSLYTRKSVRRSSLVPWGPAAVYEGLPASEGGGSISPTWELGHQERGGAAGYEESDDLEASIPRAQSPVKRQTPAPTQAPVKGAERLDKGKEKERAGETGMMPYGDMAAPKRGSGVNGAQPHGAGRASTFASRDHLSEIEQDHRSIQITVQQPPGSWSLSADHGGPEAARTRVTAQGPGVSTGSGSGRAFEPPWIINCNNTYTDPRYDENKDVRLAVDIPTPNFPQERRLL
eukprot:jgi/Mesvir1/6684/Mv08911-RA.1